MSYAATVMDAVRHIRSQARPVDLRDRHTLVMNMLFIHQMIVATAPLLTLAAQLSYKARDHKSGDYFRRHLQEEAGHAGWLAEDLAGAGFDVRAARRSRTAVAAAGTMYYMVHHVSPQALLGYMLVLEAFPMPMADVMALEVIHGEPLLRTIRHHAEADPDHARDVLEMIDASGAPEIMESAVQTAIYLNEFSHEMGQ